jgi:hypothetical protein
MCKKTKTKKELSISIDVEILNYLKSNFNNRSKFIEYCIINELKNNPEFDEKIKKIIIF